VIPYDRESFAAAPWVMDRVNEGFQTLLGDYPLRLPPKSTIFGTHPAVGGAMPVDLSRAFGELSDYPQDLRQGIFNYVLNQIDVIQLNFIIPKGGQSAQLIPGTRGRVMTVYKNFWDLDDPMTYIRNPFELTATLIHEARHADGILHTTCNDSGFSDGFNCDTSLSGPYGAELFYSQALIYGSGTCEVPVGGKTCYAKIPEWTIARAGFQMCQTAKKRAGIVYPELAAFLSKHEDETYSDCGGMDYQTTMQFENLPRRDYLEPSLRLPPELAAPLAAKGLGGDHCPNRVASTPPFQVDSTAGVLRLGPPLNLEIRMKSQ
jgi:hypothetical protein